MSLDDKTHARIRALSEQAEAHAAEGRYAEAQRLYGEALRIVPRPREDYEASTWLYAAIGDVRFLSGDFMGTAHAMRLALRSLNGLGNPFIHKRLGQALLELEQLDEAADELCRAFAVGGEEAFSSEEPKYLAFLKTRLKPEAKS